MIEGLFVINEGQIAIYMIKNKELEMIKKEGDSLFSIEKFSWEFWRDKVEFIEGDTLDLCFIYDREYQGITDSEFCPKNFKSKSWDINSIILALEDLKISARIKDSEGKEFGNSKATKIFYTNLVLDNTTKIVKRNVEKKQKSINVKETDMYRGLRSMREAREREIQERRR